MVETYSRICMDDDLKMAGWDPKDISQVQTSYHISLSDEDQKFYGKKSLQADYILKDTRGIPIAVVEAKKMKLDPFLAMDQAKRYAKLLNVRFVYTGNGKITYFYDRELEGGQVQVVDDFAAREDLMRLIALKDEKRRKPFSEVLIDTHIAGGFDEELQKERYYQKDCIEAVCASLENGKKKLLVHMATGTGKTRVMIALVKRLIQSGRLNRCLFLVDRVELARQARRVFREHYRDATTVILKSSNIENEKHKQIHICTLQTLINYYKDFRSTFYDLVIVDECHRSIYGVHKATIDHFVCPIIGLTATPKIPNAERVDLEIYNTYRYFDCLTKKPDYQFDMAKGIKEGFLAPYKIEEVTTYLTGLALDKTKGIEFDKVLDPESNEIVQLQQTKKAFIEDLEKELTSPERNKRVAEEVKSRTSFGEKVIIFVRNQRHAIVLRDLLNEKFPQYKNDRYEYAEAIINANADYNDLVLENFYNPDKPPFIAISVDILSTGIDIPCLRYIAFARQTKSAVLYTQMRGRGTRFDKKSGKNYFTILDFIGQTKLMNDEDSRGEISFGPNYPPRVAPKEVSKEDAKVKIDPLRKRMELLEADPRELIIRKYIDYTTGDIEYVDKYFTKEEYQYDFENKVRNKEGIFEEIVGKLERTPEYVPESEELDRWEKTLQGPELYISEEDLRKAYNQPVCNLWDFVRYIFNPQKFRLPTKEERILRQYDGFVRRYNLCEDQRDVLLKLSKIYVANNRIPEDFFLNPMAKGFIGYSKKEAEALFVDKGGLNKYIEEINTTFK